MWLDIDNEYEMVKPLDSEDVIRFHQSWHRSNRSEKLPLQPLAEYPPAAFAALERLKEKKIKAKEVPSVKYFNVIDLLAEHTEGSAFWTKTTARRMISGLTAPEMQELIVKLNLTKVAGEGDIVSKLLNIFNDAAFKDEPINAKLSELGVTSYTFPTSQDYSGFHGYD